MRPACWPLAVFLVAVGAVAAVGAAPAGEATVGNAAAPQAARPTYPNHSRLLVWRDEHGVEHPVKSADDWQKRRAHILAGMQEVMGKLPDRTNLPPLDVRVIQDVRQNELVQLKISFAADSGDRVPAYLLLPAAASAGRRPAMLVLHQTAALGKGESVGQSTNPNMAYGLELARRGYVVIVPDYPSFGDYRYDFTRDKYESGTMKAIFNHMRAIDVLVSRPEVDPERIGAIGHSLGGHNAIFVGAFDDRVKVIVSSCGWTPFHDYYKGDLTGWTQERYMPRVAKVYQGDPNRMPFDFYETLAALAPRAFFSNSPLKDANFDIEGVRKAERIVRPVYELLGAADRFKIESPDCPHDFPPQEREHAYAFIDRVLGNKPPAGRHAGQEAKKSTDMASLLRSVPPHEPADAMSTFEVLDNFRLEQVASEPLVSSPVAIAFDASERLYVVQMHDYPESPLAKTGRVRLLEDTDHDGHWDKAHDFAGDLSWPTAITCYDGGIFVGAAPDILYLKDTDGDGRADVRRVVFTGFERGNVQGLLNSLTWGLDGRIHGATSLDGGRIATPSHPDRPSIRIRGRDFAFDPKSLVIEPTSGGGQHGMTFDDFGHKFVCSNSDHIQAVMFEDRYIARNPRLAAPSARISIATDGPQAEVYRISPVEAWRTLRTQMRVAGNSSGPIEGGGRASGYFTGATGVTIYRGDAWPAKYYGMAIVGDVGSNLVHRKRVTQKGVGWIAERIDPGREFVSSRDIWFRPVGFANVPDGSLYIIDMYREVIEHPDALPPSIKQHLDTSSGQNRGRLYRVVPPDFKQRPPAGMAEASTEALVALIEHPNAWHRETAARLLVERADGTAADGLARLVQHSSNPASRVQALYVLASLGKLDTKLVLAALRDADEHVREHAVRLAERTAANSLDVLIALGRLVSDPSPRVRYQLAFTLGEIPGPAREDALARLAAQDADDPWINLAIQSSLMRESARVLKRLAGRDSFLRSPGGVKFLESLAMQVGAAGQAPEISEAMDAAKQIADRQQRASMAIVRGLGQSLSKGGHSPAERLSAAVSGKSRALVARLVRDARKTAADLEADVLLREEAVRFLRFAPYEESANVLTELLSPGQPQQVQLAVIQTLSALEAPNAAAQLVEAWPDLSPSLRSAAVEALFSRRAWLPLVLQSVEEGKLSERDVDPARIIALRKDANTEIRAAAERIAGRMQVGRRKDIVDAYQAALERRGDPTKGQQIFQRTCAACHRTQGVGHELGPNLAAMRNRGPAAILTAVLDPNREVNPQYVNYLVQTSGGRTLSGIIVAESASSVTLKRGEDATDTVLRSDVDEMHSTGMSLMPEGLEKQIDVESMADLLAYLMSLS